MLSLTDDGLQFDEGIELEDIELEVGADVAGPVADAYRSLRCVVNPAQPSKANLRRSLRRAQRQAKVDFFNIGYGDEDEPGYDTCWTVRRDGEFIFEGQRVYIVGLRGRKSVGYASVNVSIYRGDEGRSFSLTMSPYLVYVAPKQRGTGCGMALSVAAGWVGCSLLEVLYAAVPSGSSLGASVIADYDSAGGERFVEHLTGSLGATLDYLREERRRPSLKVGDAVLDAGW